MSLSREVLIDCWVNELEHGDCAGDSLLFAAGAFAALGTLNVWALLGIFITAAILGDALNYAIGNYAGKCMLPSVVQMTSLSVDVCKCSTAAQAQLHKECSVHHAFFPRGVFRFTHSCVTFCQACAERLCKLLHHTSICAGAKAIESGLVRRVSLLLEYSASPWSSLPAQAI